MKTKTGWPHIICYQLIIIFILVNQVSIGQSLSFRKINSGTKSDIISIKQDIHHGVYFLTDKIYALDKDTWKKLDFPVEGKIYTFCPVSAQDIWFSVTQVTNTSMLYHYHEGKIENIRPPFSNPISFIYFVSENSALFAGHADIAVYENGSFRIIPPLPARYVISKVFGKQVSAFYVLSSNGELFLYEHGHYEKVLGDKIITDFCFADIRDGYLLSADELYRVDDSGLKLILKSIDLLPVKKIYLLEDGTVLMVGDNGVMLSYSYGHLSRLDINCKENLTDLIVTEPGEVWICGVSGRLMYSGEKQFPE